MKHTFLRPGILPVLLAILLTGSLSCKKNSLTDHYEELRKNVPEQFRAFVNPFGDGSTIGAAANLASDIVILYDEAGLRYAWYQHKKIQGVFNIKDSAGPLGACKLLDNINAAAHLSLLQFDLILLFDNGGQFTFLAYDPVQFNDGDTTMPASVNANYSTNSAPASNFKGPFEATGFEAAVSYVRLYSGEEALHFFEKGGTRYARYVNATNTWGPITQFTDWGGNNNLFTTVGAATRIILNNITYNLFISKDGSQLGAWHLEGGTSVFEGPWKIN